MGHFIIAGRRRESDRLLDFSAHDGAPSLERKVEGVRRELVTKFPIGSPVADVTEALQRWGDGGGGHC